MIRTFQLRDVVLMRRLCRESAAMQTESALTKFEHPLRTALFNVVPGGQFSTYVWKAKGSNNAAGFAQLRRQVDTPHAQIIYLGIGRQRTFRNKANFSEEDAWLSLLDDLVAEVGRQGLHSLEAEVNEVGPELPLLRQANFAVYTRQDIWRLQTLPQESPAELPTLQQRRAEDDWDIHLLYANTVPRLVQLVEPSPPLDRGRTLVVRDGDELEAFAHMAAGPRATWLRFFLHPNAEANSSAIVHAALLLRPPTVERPIYCAVRRYQSWLQRPLETAGFEYMGSQAVMVRHTVKRIERPLPDLARMLERQAVRPGSSTFARQSECMALNRWSIHYSNGRPIDQKQLYLFNNLGQNTLRQAQGAHPELVEGYLPHFLR